MTKILHHLELINFTAIQRIYLFAKRSDECQTHDLTLIESTCCETSLQVSQPPVN